MTNCRHWDLWLISINKLPKNLTPTNTNILMKWNHWHYHTCDNWIVYIIKDSDLLEWQDFIFWYLEAKNTTLYHEDHWELVEWSNLRIAKIPDWFYELIKQKEYTPEWLKIVID
jgi:hypothetical protein